MRIVQRISPDGRLVSGVGTIPIFGLETPTDPLPDSRATYWTRHARFRFSFTFVRWSDGGYRAYIREQPHYRGRRTGGVETHRNLDGLRGHFICWVPAPTTAHDMLKVARYWAEETDLYITRGKRIGAR
jgi:hypothetical protein